MKLFLALLLAVCFACPAFAQDTTLTMLVIDKDPKGTNVRETPGGKILHVIPYGGKTDAEIEMRAVSILKQDKNWFLVRLANTREGWMHQSVLGTCASATEDGDPYMYTQPSEKSPQVGRVKDGTPLTLQAIKGNWVQTSYTNASGKKVVGWMMEQCMSANPFNNCHER